jgi:hypothetical protein
MNEKPVLNEIVVADERSADEYYVEENRPAVYFLGFIPMLPARKVSVRCLGPLSTAKGDTVPKHLIESRRYEQYSRLIKAVNVMSSKASAFTIYRANASVMSADAGMVSIFFDDTIEEPLVRTMWTKYVEYESISKFSVNLIFKDEEQMRKFLIAVPVSPDPEQRSSISSGSAHPIDSSSMWPLAAGIALGVALS